MNYKEGSNRDEGKRNGMKNSDEKLSDAFDHSRIANFSDDLVGVLGWKGAGMLLMTLIFGFSIYKLLFN